MDLCLKAAGNKQVPTRILSTEDSCKNPREKPENCVGVGTLQIESNSRNANALQGTKTDPPPRLQSPEATSLASAPLTAIWTRIAGAQVSATEQRRRESIVNSMILYSSGSTAWQKQSILLY